MTEFTAEGFNPDRTAIPLLEEVFVPLDLSGAVGSAALSHRLSTQTSEQHRYESSSNLQIWDLLARTRRERPFRQMSILAKGGMGKTTLLRHVALIYAQGKHRKYQAPKLVPVLLRLRDYREPLTQAQPPSLPQLITEFHLPSLLKDQSLTPPSDWATKLLESDKALIMLDGFDELPQDKRPAVSCWISAQMQQYREAVFIVTSRPAGFADYVAQKPAIPIFVNKFSPKQQEKFIRRWYLCQERCCRSTRQIRQAREVAKDRADQLIAQLRQRPELAYMAENPLLLNLLTTYHRFDPSRELPRWRLDLYRGICKLQLDDRPRARLIHMLLLFEKSQTILQNMALAMVKANRFTLERQPLLKFLEQQHIFQQEEVEPASWLKQMVEVSELLMERDLAEAYEFPHLSFQGFFAATRLAKSQTAQDFQTSARLILQNWNSVVWRETVLLYMAQLSPSRLDQVIRKACELGSEAAALAAIGLEEYPRSDQVSNELRTLLTDLTAVAQTSKYQRLEELLKAQQWIEADQETYRLMITAVGKEEGQWFKSEELLNFPCKDLKVIDGLWDKYSQGRFGFSVQKRIYEECGAKLDGNYPGDEIWEKFGDRVGWREDNNWLSYSDLNPSLSSPQGIFPCVGGGRGVFSSLAQRLVNCSIQQF
jgi:predicted NACHT family NTPase